VRNLRGAKAAGSEGEFAEGKGVGRGGVGLEEGVLPRWALQPFLGIREVLPGRDGGGVCAHVVAQHAPEEEGGGGGCSCGRQPPPPDFLRETAACDSG